MNNGNSSCGCFWAIALTIVLAVILSGGTSQFVWICVFAISIGLLIYLIGNGITKPKNDNVNNSEPSIDKTDYKSDATKESITEMEPVVIKVTNFQFSSIKVAVDRGLDFCRKLSNDDSLRIKFFEQAANSGTYQSYSAEDFYSTLKFFFANDLFDCFKRLGNAIETIAALQKPVYIDYEDPLGQCLFATLSALMDKNADYHSFCEEILSTNQKLNNPFDSQIRETIENTLPIYLNSGASITANGVDDFNIVLVLRTLNEDESITDIRKIYLDFANAIALSDSNVDISALVNIASDNEKEEVDAYQTVAEDPMKQLDGLIGLNQVKTELQALTRFIEINQKRREAGLRIASISYHCVFVGNPGTGKTTVARILAGIYKQLGILKKGQLVETDRSGLVAEYVGQTAVKTNKIIDKAIGGVLFIDEAYTLAQGGENDFGREAIATLLKRMEDDRDRLVVILAGYTDEIEQFINSNPGLRSRFNRYIHFEDYTVEELFDIFQLQAKKYDYRLDEEAESTLRQILQQKVAQKNADFGNARYVRNLFEKVIENQAVRLSKSHNLAKADLLVIKKEDIHD